MKNQTKNDAARAPLGSNTYKVNKYHSLKNNQDENHLHAERLLTRGAALKTEWRAYELQCAEKIETNTRNIAQYRLQTPKIGSGQREKYLLKITDLEKKNNDLRSKLKAFSKARQKELAAFNEWQQVALDNFKAEFDGQMDILI